jgi:protein-tyrosine phosphatase
MIIFLKFTNQNVFVELKLKKLPHFRQKFMNKTKELYGIPDPSFILPNLILGSKYDLLDNTIFEKFNITSILCVAEECKHHQMKIPKGVVVKKIFIEDSWNSFPPQTSNFEDCIEFIHKNVSKENESQEICYVHCMRGRSRSSSVIISYLIKKKEMSLKDAYLLVKEKRPFIGKSYLEF